MSLYEPASVRSLFDEMSATYGLVNLISSFGFAAHWRHLVVKGLSIAPDSHVVDLMSGMSELCRSVAHSHAMPSHVTGVDISPQMIGRAKREWPFPLDLVLADVLKWEFPDRSADVVISSFGLKTFDHDQQAHLARRVAQLLRPGGVFSFIEISVPARGLLCPLYMIYLERVVPWIGRIFLGNPANYRLLGIYTRAFGDCTHFASCLGRAGLQVNQRSHFFGCATSVRGIKPG